MSSWWKQLKRTFSGKTDIVEVDIERYKVVIQSDDPNDIEGARDWVKPEEIEPLMALYWQLDDWDKKRNIVDILQDQYHDDLPKMMLDYLRAPLRPGEEWVEISKAVALGFIDEKYDRFMTYYNDRKLLARDVAEVLRKNGLKAEQPPPPEKKVKKQAVPAGGSPNQRLMDNAIAGNLAGVRQALADGANIDTTYAEGTYIGCTPLIMAFMRKQFEVADLLIERGANVNHKRSDRHRPDPTKGQTPLWWAANHGHIRLVQQLLENNANVNTPDHHGSTPLCQAASAGHLEVTRYLVEQGADIHARIYDNRKAFNLAVTNGRTRVVEYLLSIGNSANEGGSSGYSPLMLAVDNNFYELAKLLIRQGAEVNGVHPGRGIYAGLQGWTPLVFAVRKGYVRMSKLLLQSGADVHYRVPGRVADEPARGMLEFVKGKRAESIKKVLLDAGLKE